MANGISDIGNLTGYLYVTATDGTTIISNVPNNAAGRQSVQIDALTRAPLSGEVAAEGSVTLGGIPANTTALTVNGVAVITGTVAAGGSLALTAQAIATNINSTISTPDYSAYAVSNVVYIRAAPGAGASPNGFVVVATVAAGMTATTSNMGGGADSSGVYDTSGQGRRYFINSDYGGSTAVPGSLTNAIEITQYLNLRGLQSSIPDTNVTIASGVISITRTAAIMNVVVDTEGSAASDDLNTIVTTGFNQFDVLILRGANSARVVTVKQYSSGSDNIGLANSTDFVTGTNANTLVLQYMNTGGGANWYENSRSPNLPVSVANLRAAGIAAPVQGVNGNTMGTSGTVNFTAGTDKGVQLITGSPVLVGGIVYGMAGSPMDGDSFKFLYRATPTVGGQTVTIAGITLTSAQAAAGAVDVVTVYRSSNTTWYSSIIPVKSGIDYATVASLSAYQLSLGLPAVNGLVPSSDTAGNITWVAIQNQIQRVTINIPTAQVLTLHGSPVLAVAAPGVGFTIEVLSAFAYLTFNSAAYTTNLLLQLINSGATTAQADDGSIILKSTVSRAVKLILTGGAGTTSTQMIENTDLNIMVASNNPAAGDSDISVSITYQIVPV